MKLFRVVLEQDGETKKEPGKTETEIERISVYYAAHTIEQVWKALEPRRKSGEVIFGIDEAVPAITILSALEEG